MCSCKPVSYFVLQKGFLVWCAIHVQRKFRLAHPDLKKRPYRWLPCTWAMCIAVMALQLMLAPTVVATETPELIIANAGEPETLDPHRYNLRLEETLLNDLFMGLTTFNAAGEIVPGAALHWTTSTDGLIWTFQLHPELRWSDGKPLVAADFVYAYRRLQDPSTAASLAYFMHMLKNAAAINRGEMPPETLGVTAPDPHTLVLELEKPYPFLLERLLYPTAYPVPAHVIEQVGDDWIKPAHWVSNGAYTLKDWKPQAYIDLVANPQFISPPMIRTARYVPVVNEQSAFNRFRNGELHVIPSFPVGNLAELQAQQAPELRLSPLLSMFYLVFQVNTPPFDQVAVRQALALAIDQRILTDKVMRNGATPAFSFTPAMIKGYQGFELPHADKAMDARVQQAIALLAQAGFDRKNPLTVKLRHVNNLENKKINLAISGMWRRIGVRTSLQQSDVRSHFADLRQGKFEAAWAGWVGENNAEHYLGLLQSDIGNVNYGRFANRTYDALMRHAQNEADLAGRNQLLAQAEEVAAHFYPVVPLYSSAVRRLVHPHLQGWQENARDMHQLRYLVWQPRQAGP